MKRILLANPKLVEITVEVLSKGGLVIFPTETAYGVGVDATSEAAVSKLLKYKKRPEGKAISIGCADKSMAENYVEINETAANIYKQFLPGPVTVISKSKGKVDPRLESEMGTLGIRIPAQDKILEIIKDFGKPMTTTSANSSGKKTPYSVEDVLDTLTENQKSLIDLIIDGGELPKRQTSTVIDTTTEELRTYRQGDIVFDKINWLEEITVSSEEEMIETGKRIFEKYQSSFSSGISIFLLRGVLGAGKTYFTKGIAQALGIERTIKSPTYNYVSEYKIESQKDRETEFNINNPQPKTQNSKLYHLDAWRIETKEDLEVLRIKEWFKEGNVIVIEWPDIVMNLSEELKQLIKNNHAKIVDINSGSNDSNRIVRIGEF